MTIVRGGNTSKNKMFRFALLSLACVLTVESRSLWQFVTDMFESPMTPEDATLNITQLVRKYGYTIEEHQVLTPDSYIINFYRIPNKTGEVVFLMHGITESADCWVLQGDGYSLAYVLADEGFDVWMGNARGNKYCTKHAVYNDSSPEFWKFTWDEIGRYDLSTMIDYALTATKRESLYYVGHSQGTTVDYVLLSMKPEYNKKIKLMFSLAPIAWMSNVQSPMIQMFSPAANELANIAEDTILPPATYLFNNVSPLVCNFLPVNCETLLYPLIGYENRINSTLWPVILGHIPTGSSPLQFLHYGQLVDSERFCRFNYGEMENIEKYGRATPPDYDLSKIQTPLVLYYSDTDWLSDVKDVNMLKSKLPNVLDAILLNNFGHMDYLYADDARDMVYKRIIEQIRKYGKNGDIGLPKEVNKF